MSEIRGCDNPEAFAGTAFDLVPLCDDHKISRPTDLDRIWHQYGHVLMIEVKAAAPTAETFHFPQARMLATLARLHTVLVVVKHAKAVEPVSDETELLIAEPGWPGSMIDKPSGLRRFECALDTHEWVSARGATLATIVRHFLDASRECNRISGGRCGEEGHRAPDGFDWLGIVRQCLPS